MKEININKAVTIIITTHSKYLDVCELFLKLLESNWKECPFKIVVSITGERKYIKGYKCIYNKNNSTLPKCLLNAILEENTDYYIHFLGDAFFYEKINNIEAIHLINELINLNAYYCNLIPSKWEKNNSKDCYVNIYSHDIYAHSYIAFFASKKFILEEFEEDTSDLDFEIKYLKMAQKLNRDVMINNHYIITKNVFKIMPGIDKGKWNRKTYSFLKKKYSYLKLPNREKMGYMETVKSHVSEFLSAHINPKYRTSIKKFLIKYFNIKFATKY